MHDPEDKGLGPHQAGACGCGSGHPHHRCCGGGRDGHMREMIELAKEAKKELLKEKVKAKLEKRMGKKMDALADILVDGLESKMQRHMMAMENREDMHERIKALWKKE